MPSLPFTFKDLKNPEYYDVYRASDAQKGNKGVNPAAAAQTFLANRINQFKNTVAKTDGLIDLGLALNPVTKSVDMASKFFGGPGVAQGFRDGVTQTDASGKKQVVLPRMPF